MSGGHGGPHGGVSSHEEEALGKVYDARLMRRVWTYVRPHRGLIGLSLILLLAVSAVQLAQPWLIKLAIDGPIARREPHGLIPIVAVFGALLAAEFSLRFLQIYVLERTGQNVVHDLRVQVYTHMQKLSPTFFDRNPVGRLVTRVTTDVEALAEIFSSGVVTLLGDSVKLVGIVALLFWMDVRLAALTVTVLPLLGVVAFFFRIRIRDAFRLVRARVARLNAYLAEALGGITVVQLFQRERANEREFAEINRAHREADLASVGYDSIFSSIIELAGTLALAMILWFGGGRVLLGAITFGTLVAFLEYAQKLFGPIKELGGYYAVMQSAMASSERIFSLLDTTPGIVAPARPVRLPPHAPGRTGSVEFDDVHFAYPDGLPVLRGLSFRVSPGEKIALVGSTGAGKSTIVRLLLRLYDPQSGAVRIDGVDVRDMDLDELRRRVGVVSQDHVLFSGTIAGVIGLGDPSISRERIEQAARAVRAHGFISSLPRGYDDDVRERGANFSMGQRQLLSFARALAVDPPVLVLDEATASVDSRTEMEIQAAMHTLMEGRTSLVIAHRLSTIRESDRILVLHHGVVREHGTHDELLARDGIYRMLHRLQFMEHASPST